jgi:hypothetical protein
VSATHIHAPDEHRLIIETFDYRSEFSFDDFCDWLSETLKVAPERLDQGNELAPRPFKFEGNSFSAAWSDEFGSHIEGRGSQRQQLERIQAILMGR